VHHSQARVLFIALRAETKLRPQSGYRSAGSSAWPIALRFSMELGVDERSNPSKIAERQRPGRSLHILSV
jgi:hypothetical protein